MKKIIKVTPDISMVENYSPITASFIDLKSGNLSSIKDEFAFPENADGETPFYIFSDDEVTELNIASEQVYNALVDSLDILFSPKYKHLIPKFFGKEFISKYPEFVEYAIHTYKSEHPAIYGRFDIAYDFISRKILGFYEGNLDTPTMYFDSVIMQNHLVSSLGMEESQFNLHQEKLLENIKKLTRDNADVSFGFLCDPELTEDMLTTELLYNTINDGTEQLAYFFDLYGLEYNFASDEGQFTHNDVKLNYIYVLYPWEDMVVDMYNSSPANPLKEWHKWADNTKFLEPAWRWFVSNKGIWAWLTYLKEVLCKTDLRVEEFVLNNELAWRYIIPSYVDKPDSMTDFVMKPLTGRMSNNILFYENNKLIHETDGFYEDDDYIYQKLVRTSSADGGQTSAIVCTWLSPYNLGGMMDMEASGIAVREFTGDVLEVSKERFVPHLMLEHINEEVIAGQLL